MEEGLTQVGVGGVLAILIIREVFTFMGRKKNGNSAFNKALCDERHMFRKLDKIMEHLPGK
jgi:hypothetical protein